MPPSKDAPDAGAAALSNTLRVLRRRRRALLACVGIVPILTLALSLGRAPLYEASAEVLLSRQNLASALTGTEDSTLFVDEERLAQTQAELAMVPTVATRTLREAGVDGLTVRDFLAGATVGTKGTTDILVFSMTDGDPARARRLATSHAREFVKYRGELDTEAIGRARVGVTERLRQLERDSKADTALYASLEEKEQQLATLATLQTSRAYVVRTADEALQVAPRPFRDAVIGLVLGVLLGVVAAFARDALDTRVRTAQGVAEHLGLPLLAWLPPAPAAGANGIAMVSDPAGMAAEAFRMLRTNLDFARLAAGDVKTVIITSAVEEEGKSTTAANLAFALARSGRRVALVDLDLRRPSIDRLFGVGDHAGVTDVALGRVPLERAVLRVRLEASGTPSAPDETGLLHILLSGPLPPDPGEFVGTRALATILEELRAAYDVVILDTPPVLRVGDAMALSPRADGLLVVARLGVVTRPMLTELRDVIESAPTRRLGYAATGAQAEAGETYGYAYGYGDTAGQKSSAWRRGLARAA